MIEKGQAELNGATWSIKDIEGAARARTRLFSNEKFARLNENKPDGLSLTWRGDLVVAGKSGAPTFDAMRATGQKALAASTDDERRAAFGLATDGRLSVSRVSAQTQDAAGRPLAQVVEILDMARQGGEVDVRRYTQDTQGFQIRYTGPSGWLTTRTIREAGKPDVVERSGGRHLRHGGSTLDQRHSPCGTRPAAIPARVQLHDRKPFLWPRRQSPRHSRRTQIKDGQVTRG
jgi:hypothetical protein